MAKNEKPKFEALMTRLEEIVSSLESGSADLDESLALYEEGIGLVAICQVGRGNNHIGHFLCQI